MTFPSCYRFAPFRPHPLALSLLAMAALSACGPLYRAEAGPGRDAGVGVALITNPPSTCHEMRIRDACSHPVLSEAGGRR